MHSNTPGISKRIDPAYRYSIRECRPESSVSPQILNLPPNSFFAPDTTEVQQLAGLEVDVELRIQHRRHDVVRTLAEDVERCEGAQVAVVMEEHGDAADNVERDR
jgi:hypothetical protein